MDGLGLWSFWLRGVSAPLLNVGGSRAALEPAPRDPRGGEFDPGDAAAFAAASAPSLPGVPQGQSGFASRGG